MHGADSDAGTKFTLRIEAGFSLCYLHIVVLPLVSSVLLLLLVVGGWQITNSTSRSVIDSGGCTWSTKYR